MELMKRQLPRNWEERWRKEKEQRKKMQEEGGEGLEAENRKLRWIVAHNSLKMGVRGSKEHGEERQEQYEEKEDEETAPMFHSHRHPVEMFQATREFRDSGLLTDVTLRTSDGGCFSLHFPIMAAVSSLLCQQLQHRDKERKPEEKSDGNETKELSIPMGPEVESTGLAAVVEFAYTGTIMNLNRYTLAQVRAAAKALQVSRILELCSEKEEKVMAKGAEKPQERIISSERQLEISLEHIEHLRKTRLGCDVELEAEGRIFHAHRVVLAASSDYFRGMFTSGMRESYRQTIALLSLGSVELEALLNCSYSGSLPLSWGSVFQTTATALQLQVQPALSLCFEFLHQQIDANSCLDVASFAEAFGLADLQELAKDFVLRHFTEVAATPKFLDLPSDKLLEYLHCDSLCAPSELAVFRAVVAWIEADPEERMVFAKDLMKGVRFQLMTFREFREVRAINLRMECAGEKEVELYGAALKEFGFGLSNSQDQSRVRHPNDSLLVIGGDNLDPDFGQRRPSRQLWYINSLWSKTGLVKEVEWRLLGEMPESARLRHAVSVLGGQLYVAGGCHYYATADTLKSVYRYDPLQNTWQRLADMNEQRSNFSLVVRDKQLYAIGGDRIINNNLDSVECYCPESNCWSFSHPLDQALSGHAATVWEGEVFISGGFDCRYQCLVSMFLYHPERGTTYLCNMGQDRALHCMEKLAGRLYVAGGVCNLRKFYTDQFLCESYNPLTDSWSSVPSLTTPHVSGASAVLEDKIYILGGYCQEDYSEPGLVHRYDPATLRWENMGRMPGPNADIRACILHLPPHLRRRQGRQAPAHQHQH